VLGHAVILRRGSSRRTAAGWHTLAPMAAMREVWRMSRAGSLDRLQRETEAVGEPGPGEVRIRVEAVGLNFADVFAALGLYSATPKGPFVPGLECAGVVDAVGAPRPGGSPARAVGDRVMAVTRFGGYATAAVLDAREVAPLPEAWSFAQGAAFPVQALTAWWALVRLGELAAGDVVLVHSAAGGVGLQALALVEAAGARVLATVGRPEKRDFLVARGLSPRQVIVRDRRRFGPQLDAALAAVGADGLDLVLDAVLGPFFAPAFERLRPEGRHIVFGAADFMTPGARPDPLRLAARWLRRPRVDPLAMIEKNRGLLAFNLIWLWSELDRLPAAYADLARLGALDRPPHVGARLPFARAPEAMRLLQSGATTGKVVLEVGGA
jgi:synaptic vesicle membrane protein VAT-1